MNTRYTVLLFIVALAGLISCKNNDNVFKKPVSSYLKIANASTDTLSYFVNGTRQNNGSSLVPGGQSQYYLVVPAGAQNYQFKKIGNPNFLFGLPLTLKDSMNYSLYVTDETAGGTYTTNDFLDTTGISKPNAIKIRFVNTSADAGNLTVSIGDTVKCTGCAFKTTSLFALNGSGQKRVKIYLEGVATPKIDTTIAMPSAHLYTLFAWGPLTPKGKVKFSVGAIVNY